MGTTNLDVVDYNGIGPNANNVFTSGLASRGIGGRFTPGQKRIVGTKHGVPSAGTFGGSTNGTTFRLQHRAPAGGVMYPELTFSGSRLVPNSSPSEAAVANAFTLKAAIEYPIGAVPTPITFGGSASTTINPGVDVTADACPVFIPPGADYGEITVVTVAASGNVAPIGHAVTAGLNEGYASGDQSAVAGQVFTGGGAGVYGASAIVGSPIVAAAPARVILGDSIADRTGDTTGDALGNRGWIARGLAARNGYVKSATGGDSSAKWLAAHALRTPSYLPFVDTLIYELGVNSCYAENLTLTQMQNQALQVWYYHAKFGMSVYATTITPYTTSTDNWATVANQSAYSSAQDAVAVAYNTWIRSVPAPLAGIFDVAALAESGLNSRKWAVPSGVGAPTTDGIHPVSAMAAFLAGAVPTTF